MSRNISARSAIGAIVAAALAVAVLLGLILYGHHAEEEHALESEPLALALVLPTAAQAQLEAGSWTFESSQSGGEGEPARNTQKVSMDGDEAQFRTVATSGDQTHEVLVVGDDLFIKAPDADESTPWWKVPADDPRHAQLTSNLHLSDPAMLRSIGDPTGGKVVGVEELTSPNGDKTKTLHYRLEIESQQAAMGAPAQVIDVWLDAEDRPVRISTGTAPGPVNTLDFMDFGEKVDLDRPASDQVTDQAPPSLSQTQQPPAA